MSGGNIYESDNVGSAEDLAGQGDLLFVSPGGVTVTPDGGPPIPRLPSNGVGYSQAFVVTNTGGSSASFSLLAEALAATPPFLTIDSIRGTAVTQGAQPDVATVGPVGGNGGSRTVTVWYSVAGVPAGSAQDLRLTATQVGTPSVTDPGFVTVSVVRPSLAVDKDVLTAGPFLPGGEVSYTILLVNNGSHPATSVVTTDELPPQVDFKLGSVTSVLPASSVTVAYSSDYGTTWAYTPVSGGCGAPAGFDRCVTHIRWTFSGALDNVAPGNSITYGFVTRVR
jgi:uncharacterized repeat protein (TIGR01451 family)